jgi:hypothetical protein
MTMNTPFRRTVVALGCALAASMIVPQAAQAAPFATAGAGHMVGETIVVEAQARRRPPVARKRGNNNAAVAAAIGIGVLGLAAAAAASQRRSSHSYYADSYGYPVDAWGRPVYGSSYSYGRQPQYYDDGGYYGRPVRAEPRLSRWEKEQIKAQERARREAVKQAVRRERAEREWAWRQQQGDWRYRDDWRYR